MIKARMDCNKNPWRKEDHCTREGKIQEKNVQQNFSLVLD